MNKLEQLKALIAEEKKWRREWTNAWLARDDSEDVWSLRLEYYSAKQNRSVLSEELLPHLIAAAEGTRAAVDAWEAKRLNGDIMAVAIGSLKDSLLPLIEDTDK